MNNNNISQHQNKKYNVSELWELLQQQRLVDKYYRFIGWEHLTPSTNQSNTVTLSIIHDLLLLINGDKQYLDRGSTQELRIPEDVCTNILYKLDNKF